MKKVFLSLILTFISVLSISASMDDTSTVIKLNYNPVSNGVSVGRPRTPVNSPTIIQDGHTLLFGTINFCHSILLINTETEEIVYETTMPENIDQITLPLWLEGDYEIRFYRETYYYYGIIEL